MSNFTNSQWHIVYAREKCEKKASAYLQKKGIEFFCPVLKPEHTLHHIKSGVGESVLAGYIFVKVNEDELHNIKSVPGVLNVIYWLDKPVSIRNEDMSALQKFFSSHAVLKTEHIKVNFDAHTTVTNILRDNRSSNPKEVVTYTSILKFPAIGYAFIAEDIKVDIKVFSHQQTKKSPPAKVLAEMHR